MKKGEINTHLPVPAKPIKDIVIINNIKEYIRNNCDIKYYYLFSLGINCGLRISDLVALQVKDIDTGYISSPAYIKEQKTQKRKRLKLNEDVRSELMKWINENQMQANDFLFPSREGGHIKTNTVYKVLKQIGDAQNPPIHLSTHVLRKTFATFAYLNSGKDIAAVMKLLQHSSQSITLRYLGLDDDREDEIIQSFHL